MRTWTRRSVLQAMGGGLALPLVGGIVTPGSVAAEAVPTAAPDASTPLMRMLSLTPDVLPDWNRWLSFADLGQAKHLYGYDDVHSFADLPSGALIDFSNAIGGCYLTNDTFANIDTYRDAFGYDFFQVDRELAMGQPPNVVTRLEGSFDPDTIHMDLMAAAYMDATFQGAAYATIRDDFQLGSFNDPHTRLVLAHLNRLAYGETRILTAGGTGGITAMLGGEQGTLPTLAANPTYAALALALGDVTSMAIADNTDVSVVGNTNPAQYKASVADWGTLHPPLLVAMGYTDAGDNNRTMHVAIVYANPDDAEADAPELVKRLMTYQLVRSNMPFIPTYAIAVTSRTATIMGQGVLIADVALVPNPARVRLWVQMLLSRDTLFLVPDPAIRHMP